MYLLCARSRKWKVANMNFAQQQQWSVLYARMRGIKRLKERLQYFHIDRFKHATLVEAIQATQPWQEKFGPSIKVRRYYVHSNVFPVIDMATKVT